MNHEEAVQKLLVEQYLLNEMTPAERESFEEHYFECAVCAAELRASTQFVAEAKRHWLANPSASPKEPTAWNWLSWLRPQIAIPAMATLLVVASGGIFSSFQLREQLREATEPRIMATVTLHPETRGAPVLITVQPDSPVILEFDLLKSHTDPLQYVVRSTEGKIALRLLDAAGTPKDRVTVQMPKFDLAPGLYTLSVEPLTLTDANASEVEQFRFQVQN